MRILPIFFGVTVLVGLFVSIFAVMKAYERDQLEHKIVNAPPFYDIVYDDWRIEMIRIRSNNQCFLIAGPGHMAAAICPTDR